MTTYYKASRWRGKRLVYRSTDPNEPKRYMVKIIIFLVVGIIFLATIWLCLDDPTAPTAVDEFYHDVSPIDEARV